MEKNDYKFKNDWLLCHRIFSITAIFFIVSCQTTFKQKPFAEDRTFIIRGSYINPQKKLRSVTSYVYIKGDNFLRVDVVIPIRGSIARFVLNKNQFTLQMPLKKEFYQGSFKSQLFLPQFRSFPKTWLFALLNAKPLKQWKCSSILKNKRICKVKDFTIEWVFDNSHWKEVYIINSSQEKIKIKLYRVLRKKLKEDIFSLSLKGYKRQKSLSFR